MQGLDRMLAPMRRRLSMMLARGVIALVNDGKRLQTLQATFLANETRSDLERFQNYGFTSVPLPGMECLAAFLGGNRDHGIIVAIGDRDFRIKGLAGGEVAIYSDEGDSIILKRGNAMEINTQTLTINAPGGVTINAPMVQSTGDMQDNYATQGDTLAEMRGKFNNHKHAENEVSGGLTNTPNLTMG